MIQVVHNGSGPWAEYAEDGTVVSLICHGETLAIDCAARQADARVTIDVVHGADGRLAEGVRSGSSYVASLEIPPAKYTEPEAPANQETGEDEETGGGMMFGEDEGEQAERLPLTPADMITVILRLWTISENCLATDAGQEGE